MSSPLNVLTLPLGQMQANCYIVTDKQTGKALIIDPGDDADYISQIIHEKKLNPDLLLATHGHFDHIMGVTTLQLIYKIPFLIHAEDAFLIARMKESAQHFLGTDPGPPPTISGNLSPTKAIKLGKNTFTIIETPGHTPGSVCFYGKSEGVLFVGDLLFAGAGVGRTDFSYSNAQELEISLQKVFHLPADTLVYPGHGQATSLGQEKPFFLSKVETGMIC